MTTRLEDVLVDPSMADAIRAEIQEGRKRLEQSMINYRFGSLVYGVSGEDVEDDIMIYMLTLKVIESLEARSPGDAAFPLMFAIMAIDEMRKSDK